MLSRQQFETGVSAVAEFKDYLDNIISDRLRTAHNDPAEILSKLIEASDYAAQADDSERLTELN